MKKKSSILLVVFLFSVAMVISVCVMPAFAKINYESDSTYDYNGSSDYFGEEIQAKVTIDPGESEVKDMRIEIFEADALLDDGTFEHTIFPTGADISVRREGHTFFCDRLRRGESITLMFNAYPKTIKEEEIKVADVRIAYSQLGQRLEDSEVVKANLENSFWFRYDDVEKMASSAKWMFYVGVAFIIIGAILAVAFWKERWRRGIRIGGIYYDFVNYLKRLKEEGEEKKIDRDIIRNIEDKKEEIERENEYKEYSRKYEEVEVKK